MKFRYRKTSGRLISLLANDNSLVNTLASDYFKIVAFKPTRKLTAETRAFSITINDPVTYAIDLAPRNLSLTRNNATLTKTDTRATFEIALAPQTGWDYIDTTNFPIEQITWEKVATDSQIVTGLSNGTFITSSYGTATFKYRTYSFGAWSNELTGNVDQIINVDGDDSISPSQAAVAVSGYNLNNGTSARIRKSSYTLNMQTYSPSVSPTFTIPNLSTFLSSGMPLGTVSFDIMRAV